MAMLVTAGLVLPMDGRPPIRDAAILIIEGRIVAVGPRAEVEARPDAAGCARRDFGEAIALPGLVNAHVHLEYTHLGPLAAPTPFFPWIRGLARWAADRTGEEWAASARAGAAKSLRGGVTCLGEIVTRGAGVEAMVEAGLRGIAYAELVGVRAPEMPARWERFEAVVARTRALIAATDRPGLRFGLSPHAPYSLPAGAIEEVIRRAHAEGTPLAMHLAETRHEGELLLDGTGEFAAFLRSPAMAEADGRPREPYREGGHGLRPLAYVAARGLFATGQPPLLIHGVHLDAADIAIVREHGAAVALCPRSNTLLECGEAPAAALLAAGGPLGIGTDSLGSNRDLDLFAELRALAALVRRQWATDGTPVAGTRDEGRLARRLLAIATAEGARALGLDDQLGSLTPGKLADLAIVALPPDGPADDPYRALLDCASAADVRCTIVGGRVAHEAAATGVGAHA